MNISIHIYMFVYIYVSARSIHNANIYKSQPSQCALWELVLDWNKTIPPNHFGWVEMNQPTGMSNTTSTA